MEIGQPPISRSVEQMAQILPTDLQARNKWVKSTRSFQVGDIVILKDPSLQALSWPIDRVAKVYHGEDGLVHIVDLRCKEKIYK